MLSNEKVIWTSGEIICEGKTAHLTTVPHTAQEFECTTCHRTDDTGGSGKLFEHERRLEKTRADEASRGHPSRRDYVAASSGIRRSMLSDPRCIVPGIASEDEARLPERVFPVTPPRHYVGSKSLRTSGKKSSMPHCVSASRVRVQEQNSPSFL